MLPHHQEISNVIWHQYQLHIQTNTSRLVKLNKSSTVEFTSELKMQTSLLMAVYSPESMITLIHVSLVWNSKKAMLDHYNKSNTSSTILPTEINLRATLYLKDSMKEMLRVKLLPKSSRLDQKSMKDGTIKTSMKDHIQTLDSTE